MKNISLNTCMIFLITTFFYGCAGSIKPPKWRKNPSYEKYQVKAKEYEKEDVLQMALYYWKIAGSINPADMEVAKNTERLKIKIQLRAKKHFKKGATYFKKGHLKEARQEFLITLRYDPAHKEALNYLKKRLPGDSFTTYLVKEGDTIKNLALKIYNDPGKTILITYFNDLDTKGKLTSGMTLKLLIPETKLADMTINIEKKLIKANSFFQAKDYDKALMIIRKVLEYDPTNIEADDLANACYYQKGTILIRQKKHLEALKMFKKADPVYKDIQKAISNLLEYIRHEARVHYSRGVKYFVNEQLTMAIEEWEMTLDLDPDHQKAKKDIENARTLLKKLKEVNK